MNSIFYDALIYGITGTLTGLVSGVLGIGGGMLVVPALLYIFKYMGFIPPDLAVRYAAGTSLGIMIFTSQAAAFAHYRKNSELFSLYRRLQNGVIVGTVSGAICANFIPTHWIRIILGVVLLLIASEMCFKWNIPKRNSFPGSWINRFVSLIIGLKSGLLGIGGGALIIPYLTYCGVERRKTAGVASMCTLTVALLGTLVFMISGAVTVGNIQRAIGYVYWPAVICVGIPSMFTAPLGARLTYVLPVDYLKWAFFVVLVVTALNLLIS